MQNGKRPTEEIANYMGKVTLMPNRSYLFFAGTGIVRICVRFDKESPHLLSIGYEDGMGMGMYISRHNTRPRHISIIV